MNKWTTPVHDVLDGDLPLHHQIYLHYRGEIEDGRWVGRDDFPGENDTARHFGVSVGTARKALDRLVSDGFIERARGKRTKVLRSPAKERADAVPAIMSTVPTPARPFAYRVLSSGVAVAPSEACTAFGLPAGSELWMCTRLRLFKGRPHSVTLNAQPIELGRRIPQVRLKTSQMAQVLLEAGVSFAKLRRRVSASLAPAHVARHLGLTLNDPTLVYTFTNHDQSDQVVQWVRIWVRPDEPSPEEVFSYETRTWTVSEAM